MKIKNRIRAGIVLLALALGGHDRLRRQLFQHRQ